MRITRTTSRTLGLATLGLALAVTTAGAQTVYFGQNRPGAPATPATASAAFLSALTGVGTETFEGIPTGTSAPIALTFPGAGTATLAGNGAVRSGNLSGSFATSGTNFYNVTTSTGSEFTITFSSPIAAFGFFGTDLGDAGSQLNLTFTRAAGGTLVQAVPYEFPGVSGNTLFFGFIDVANPFTAITFSSTGSGDVFGFDDMTIGAVGQVTNPPPSVVPEPMSVLLTGSGLAGLALFARRRRTLG